MKVVDLQRVVPKKFTVSFSIAMFGRSGTYSEDRIKSLKVFSYADIRRINQLEVHDELNLQITDETGKTKIKVTRTQ